MPTSIKQKQSGTSVIEILITFSMIGFCLIALTKSQLLVDHGYQDLMTRTQAINQAENLAELFASGYSGVQLQQGIELWQASNQTQLPDSQVELTTNGDNFSVTISWQGRGAYPISCDGHSCDNGESMMLQGWKATGAAG